jgi:hypothetical protein
MAEGDRLLPQLQPLLRRATEVSTAPIELHADFGCLRRACQVQSFVPQHRSDRAPSRFSVLPTKGGLCPDDLARKARVRRLAHRTFWHFHNASLPGSPTPYRSKATIFQPKLKYTLNRTKADHKDTQYKIPRDLAIAGHAVLGPRVRRQQARGRQQQWPQSCQQWRQQRHC